VKALEELGVGRPSTYATIMGTIQDRGYVRKKGSALVPSWTAFAVVTLLERHFSQLVDYAFTARMEDDLDEIAARHQERVPWLRHFYFGDGVPGLRALVTDHLAEIDARDVNSIPLGSDAEDRDIVVRVGRYGPYLQRGEDRASLPEDLAPDELSVDKATELLDAPASDRVLGTDAASGLAVSVRTGRFGAYVQLGEQQDGGPKPARASLFKTMTPETVTLDEAVQLLSLPRVVGVDPDDGVEITAQNGRYGPYIKKGNDSRSLDNEAQLLTIGLDEALHILAQPKRRRGRAAAPAAPLRELGPDPVSGDPIVVKDGRYGPYATDGTTNASLRDGDAVETLTLERAAHLLQVRRETAPAKARPRKARAKSEAATKKAGGTRKAARAKKAGGTT
jgi:DNA topoisomerase-1